MPIDTVQQVVRIAAQFGAGFLVSRGIIDGGGVDLIVGTLTSAASLAWWWVWNRKR